MIIRQAYIDKLIAFRDQPIIKIITGMRRCGKSTIMALYKEYLLSEGVTPENIISIRFELMEFEDINDYKEMYAFIKSKIPATGRTYILLDEIQMIKCWEKAIDSLFAEDVADIYLTGSNSELLSSEIATMLSGRYITIKIWPLSFREYMLFVLARQQKETRQYNSLKRVQRKELNQENNIALDLKRYIRFGALPTIPFLPQEREMVMAFLEGVYHSVIIKDILYSSDAVNVVGLKKIIRYLARNTGQLLNPPMISQCFLEKYVDDRFKSNTIMNYINLLEKAFILYQAECYDIKTGEIEHDEFKYYLADTGIRNMVLLFSDTGKGHNLETIVYFELLRRGYTVFCGRYDDAEVDFYITRNGKKKCIQVVINLKEEEAWQKKLDDLKKMPEDCQKYVITMNKHFRSQDPKIQCINFGEFLLNQEYAFEGELQSYTTEL